MKFAWKPLLQSQKNALQSSSLLWHMIKGGLIMIGTMVGTNMVGAPWKLALLETTKKSSLVICSNCGKLMTKTKCIFAHCEGNIHLCML